MDKHAPAPADDYPEEEPLPKDATTNEFYARLFPVEKIWRSWYGFLKEHGYTLRPRYHPDWKASWMADGVTVPCLKTEDGQIRYPQTLMDGIRDSDGLSVVFKLLDPECFPEADLTLRLVSGDVGRDARNHCVPVYEVLQTPDPTKRLIVLPLLREVDDPPFDTIGEAVDCIRQIFEGVTFMHSCNIAHWDICETNLRMEPTTALDPFHWADASKKRDWSGRVRHTTRTRRPPRYYLIDFGNSWWFPSRDDARAPPVKGGDFTLPELRNRDVLASPFAADVYCTGNWIREEFMQRYRGLDFMKPLIDDMTKPDFMARPRINMSLRRLDGIIRSLSKVTLRSPVRRRDEFRVVSLFRAPAHWIRQALYMREGLPAIPTPPLSQ